MEQVSPEAQRLALRLLASYPGRSVAEVHIAAMADTLDRIGLHIAEALVDAVRKEFKNPPSVADLYEVAASLQSPQPPVRRRALEGPEGIPMPPEIKERVTAMAEGWAVQDEQDDAELAHKRAKATVLARPRSPIGCDGVGKEVVVVDGKRVCPDCGVEVPDFEFPAAPKRKRIFNEREASA